MTVQITWHLIIMIVITVILLIQMFKEGESELDLSGLFYGIILAVAWAIYGGIFIW